MASGHECVSPEPLRRKVTCHLACISCNVLNMLFRLDFNFYFFKIDQLITCKIRKCCFVVISSSDQSIDPAAVGLLFFSSNSFLEQLVRFGSRINITQIITTKKRHTITFRLNS